MQEDGSFAKENDMRIQEPKCNINIVTGDLVSTEELQEHGFEGIIRIQDNKNNI